jgi:hypothetical protein
MAIEEISRLVGHSSSNVTETIYRQQIRPVIIVGARGDGQDLRQRTMISRAAAGADSLWICLSIRRLQSVAG